MKKSFVAIFILMIIPLSVAFAQHDSYRSTLKKTLEAAGTEATFKTAIKQVFVMFKQQNTNVPESVWSDLENEFYKTSIDDLVDMLSPVYQKFLTEEDLEKIIEFYQTPVGKKYAEKTPLITQESMQVGQQWGMNMAQQFQEMLKKKGY